MPTSEDKQEKALCKSHERGNDRSKEIPCTSLEYYRTRYLQSVRLRERTNFTMSAETLQVLRNVLQDLGERVSMACYIDNILREHLYFLPFTLSEKFLVSAVVFAFKVCGA